MAVPNMSDVLVGWTKKRTMRVITKNFVNGKRSDTPVEVVLPINIQPMPTREIDRKPEGQRNWIWWTLLVRDKNFLFKPDDLFILGTAQYRVEKINDWRESGYSKYEVREDYQS